MSERERAIEVLRQARDLLARRLSEKILESEEELLDDARGDSYLSQIETIFDQFGTKLTHLNQLINNLPTEAEASTQVETGFVPADQVSPMAADAAMADEAGPAHPAAITGPLIISPPALPA